MSSFYDLLNKRLEQDRKEKMNIKEDVKMEKWLESLGLRLNGYCNQIQQYEFLTNEKFLVDDQHGGAMTQPLNYDFARKLWQDRQKAIKIAKLKGQLKGFRDHREDHSHICNEDEAKYEDELKEKIYKIERKK